MNIKLKCRCGLVQGVVENARAQNGNRVVCCCDDCQKFAELLGREDDVLDDFGGTDLYQTSQSQIKITSGAEHLCRTRLSQKGLNRWYTDCCNTPVANTMSAGIPFAGLIHSFMYIEDGRDKALGPVLAYVQVKHALGEPDYPHSAPKFPLGITLRIARKMLLWKVRGMNKPSAFFDENGNAVSAVKVPGI